MKKVTLRYITLYGVDSDTILATLYRKLEVQKESVQIDIEAKRGTYLGRIGERDLQVKIQTLWPIVALVLIVLLSVGTYWFVSQDTGGNSPLVDTSILPEAGADVANMSEQELMDAMQQAADKEYFQLKMNSVATFPSSDAYGEIQIVNPPNNTNPMAVEIYLKENNEKVYQSGGILPKQYVSKGKLDVTLNKGTYDAIGVIRIYDENTKKEVSTTEVVMQIVVEN